MKWHHGKDYRSELTGVRLISIEPTHNKYIIRWRITPAQEACSEPI